MSMVPSLAEPLLARRQWFPVVTVAALCGWWCASTASLGAEAPGVHYRHNGATPPGAIGTWQLERGGPLPGYFQPVEIKAPQGALISLAIEGQFDDPVAAPRLVGMWIAPLYRFKVTGIPFHEGEELFPTIEVIDRLYPPAGQETRFPIPVELIQDDLELALDGKFVTRVIYLEDPDRALPHRQDDGHENWFDVGAGGNPVKMADELGRPVAILRMGGRVPLAGDGQLDPGFLYGCPPLLTYHRDPNLHVYGADDQTPPTGASQVLPAGYTRHSVEPPPAPGAGTPRRGRRASR